MTDIMTRGEIANLERLIRKQERVRKAALDQQAAALKADFEAQISAEYGFDDDAVWKKANELAEEAVDTANGEIAKRCEELGIPKEFAPRLSMYWCSRGENAVRERRAELRKKADAEIAALKQSARTQIELWSLKALTDLASQTLTSKAAKVYFAKMPSPADLMPKLEYQQVHALLDDKSGS